MTLLEEAMQERPPPQKPIRRREEATEEFFEDADDCALDSSPPPPNNEEWEDLSSDNPTLPNQGSESYLFPGTWPAALSDTAQALREVNAATASYVTALTRSGIGRATCSIGTAALATTNTAAFALTSWGLAKTGFGSNDLPRPLHKWLQAKEEREKRRKRKEQRKRNQEVGNGVFEDGEGSFTLGTREKVEDASEGYEGEWEARELRGMEAAVESEGEDNAIASLKELDFDEEEVEEEYDSEEDDEEDENEPSVLMGFNFQDED
ncbi:hypothetical protein GMOD_00006599 [Pyrenophora seminiperda CCB06]|uniref:Uncharacterized protein n=1 Tax=Pyrenophora seminiperda CCB06 TaxID=1302712 RepID=A0A3M7MAI4_9PLEO|nr:hypothetical protein GMOD_00006599 [Pyrenophora seminiperda CCB06]